MQKSSLWDLLREPFSEKLPRRTAVLIKEDDFSLNFAYPSDFGSLGWLFDSRVQTTYDESPIASARFAKYSFPDLTGRNVARNTFYFDSMEYLPSLVRRQVVFTNIGLEVAERFGQHPDGGFFWRLRMRSRSHEPFVLDKKLYSVIDLHAPCTEVKAKRPSGCLELVLGDKKLFIASNHDRFGTFGSDDYARHLRRGRLTKARGRCRNLVLEHKVSMEQGQEAQVNLGISFVSASLALRAQKESGLEQRVKRKWDAWFEKLPSIQFDSEADMRAYYKCWWVIRSNYYRHPRWGKTVLEALPVYRGYWQWGLPAVEWHSSLNPEIGPSFVKRLLDLFLKYQRADGYVTHAIYLDEKIPGETWMKANAVQTPHIPWVALRYYHSTKDEKSLRIWYPKLVRYYRYLCVSRDEGFMKLHLWAILSSYDTGLDTTASFQRVTYGENVCREDFCYPAIFAAERCRYEQAMGKISTAIGGGEESDWQERADMTMAAMNRILWHEKKGWYGVLHQDGSLDTRVGVDGLFPLAYGLVDKRVASLAKRNFLKLLGEYGVYTVAPGEPGFEEETYWRGPAWSKSCSLAVAAASRYYPDLLKAVKDSLVRFLLKHPSVWECMSARTGKIARGDVGLMATPVVSSNVGAGEAMGALLTYYGRDVFSMEG